MPRKQTFPWEMQGLPPSFPPGWAGGWGAFGGTPPQAADTFFQGLQSALKGIHQTVGVLQQVQSAMKTVQQLGPMFEKMFGPPPAPPGLPSEAGPGAKVRMKRRSGRPQRGRV